MGEREGENVCEINSSCEMGGEADTLEEKIWRDGVWERSVLGGEGESV